MRILAYEVGQEPYIKEINGLNEMQKIVGGYIQTVTLDDGVVLVCNDEGKIMELPPNRALIRPYDSKLLDFICGDFFVCGLSETREDLDSITEYGQIVAESMLISVWA